MLYLPGFVVSRRLIVGVLALGVVSAVFIGFGCQYLQPPVSNVILITLDTTRADHIGLYGYQQGLTSALDELGRQGVVFDHAYATVPLTLPSHTSMLTGLYPPEHGLRVNGTGRLSDEIPSLPEILKKNGYDTGAFVAAFVLDSKFGLSRGFDTYDDDLTETKSAAHSTERRREGQAVVDSAIAWIQQRLSQRFFCWIHLYDAHDEYNARPALFGDKFVQHPYDAGIAVESQQIQRVMTFLKEKKLDGRTIVVIAGDHGEGLGDHAETEHGMFVYNSTLHVPFVIAGPSGCKPGHRVAAPVSMVDLTPTLLDLLGIPAPKHVSGRSLRTALSGGEMSSRSCYAETESPFMDNRWCPQHTVISARWKYIHTTRPELYDLENDPGEEKNLADSDVNQCKEMLNQLEELQDKFVLARAGNLKLSEKDLAKIRALGYVAGGKIPDSSTTANAESLADMKEMLPYLQKVTAARVLLYQGKFDEAVPLVEEVLAATKQYPNAQILLGDLYRKQGRLDDAAAAYRAVLEIQPDAPKAHAHLGTIYAMQGQYELAAAEYREVIKQDSEAAQTHYDLAQTLSRLKRYDEAIVEFREAIRSDPGYVVAHFHLGTLLANLQRPKDAASAFENAIRYEPNFAMAYTNLASMRLLLGQIDQATTAAEKAVQLDPNSFEGRFNLGVILTSQKRYDDGIAEFRAAQALRPDDPRPAERIRQSEAARQRTDQ